MMNAVVKGEKWSSSNPHGLDPIPDLVDSLETQWTNEKHSSYLDSIEASFVKKMYDSEYCALDLCGRAPKQMMKTVDPDSAESRLNFPSPFNKFKVWQKGHWQTPPDFNSQGFMLPMVVIESTWVQRFRNPTSTIDESWRNSGDKGLLHTSKTIEKVPYAGQGINAWHNRLHINYTGSASIYNKRKLNTAYDGNIVSVEVTDCNFKDEAKAEKNQENTLKAHQNFEDHSNIRTAKVGVHGGCRYREDQLVPFIGSSNTKVQGFSGFAQKHCKCSINFPSWKKRGRTSLKYKQLSGGDVGKND